MDSKFFAFGIFLPEVVRMCSEETMGELLWPLDILRNVPELVSVVCGRDRSVSPPAITASRLLETAARLADPLDRGKFELDNCKNPNK